VADLGRLRRLLGGFLGGAAAIAEEAAEEEGKDKEGENG
jgi:hypothetical protein